MQDNIEMHHFQRPQHSTMQVINAPFLMKLLKCLQKAKDCRRTTMFFSISFNGFRLKENTVCPATYDCHFLHSSDASRSTSLNAANTRDRVKSS